MDKRNARALAIDISMQIDRGGAYNNIELRKELGASGLSKADRALVTALVNGVLRNRIYLDHIISQYASGTRPYARELLRHALYQIIFMDRIPTSAACNEAVELAKTSPKYGAPGFINGVLRNVARHIEGGGAFKMPPEGTAAYLSTRYSYPRWIVDYWLEHYGWDDTASMCEHTNSAPGISISVAPTTSPDALAQELSAQGVQSTPSELPQALRLSSTADITNLRPFLDGRMIVMNEASMLVVEAMEPRSLPPGAKMMDICCAPGSKAFYAAWHTKDIDIHTFDIHPHKLHLIRTGIKRLGLAGRVRPPVLADGRIPIEAHLETAAAVLVDAPCSGLGLLQKKPDIKYNQTMENIRELAELQRGLLGNAALYVEVGGVLVYSVCSVSPLEGEEVARWFVEAHPGFVPEDAGLPPLPGTRHVGTGMVQLLPIKGSHTDGFFIAKFRRVKA